MDLVEPLGRSPANRAVVVSRVTLLIMVVGSWLRRFGHTLIRFILRSGLGRSDAAAGLLPQAQTH